MKPGKPIIRGLLAFATVLFIAVELPGTARSQWTTSQQDRAVRFGDGPGVANHPVRVVPSDNVRIPVGWPLASDGSITCLTCHHQLPSSGRSSRPFLRDFAETPADPAEFCAKCHLHSTGRTASSMHWLALGEAHVQPDRGQSSNRRSRMLDAHSHRCMGCHDGVTANEAANTTGWNRGPGYLGDMRRNHPVGVRYRQGISRKQPVRLRPAAALPRRVRLPDGQVSCVSCHDLYATTRYRLSVPIEDSALCFACHDMD